MNSISSIWHCPDHQCKGKSWKLRWGQNFFGEVFGKQWTRNLEIFHWNEFILCHFTYLCYLLKVGQILNFLYSYFNTEGLRLERKNLLCSLRDISLSQLSLIRLISPSVMAQELSQFKRYSRFTKRNCGHPELRNCNLTKHFFWAACPSFLQLLWRVGVRKEWWDLTVCGCVSSALLHIQCVWQEILWSKASPQWFSLTPLKVCTATSRLALVYIR